MDIYRILKQGFWVTATLAIIYFVAHPFLLKGAESVTDKNPDFQKVFAPPMPENPSFAGEKVPVEMTDVYERLDREFIVNTYYHSFMLLSFKRAGRWFPLIEPILKKNGIPDDFKYVAIIESGLQNVISPADAVGFWQFIESAATRFGLEVNDEVDERYNVEKSTEAACQYIKNAYEQLGSWTLAAASYNMGVLGVDRQLTRQKTGSYYDLLLNEETARYLSRIIAVKEIMHNPQRYGYMMTTNDQYKPVKTKKVNISGRIDDLITFSIKQGYNYKLLKLYNPWLRGTQLTNKRGKTYQIEFPEDLAVTSLKNSE